MLEDFELTFQNLLSHDQWNLYCYKDFEYWFSFILLNFMPLIYLSFKFSFAFLMESVSTINAKNNFY